MISMWGLFRTFRQANELVIALGRLKLPPDDINVLLPEAAARSYLPATGSGPAEVEAKPRAGLPGLLAGAEAGGLVTGGGLLAAGPLTGAFAHAAAAGKLAEALAAAGLSPAYAGFYLQGLKGGAFLIITTLSDAQERESVNLYRQFGVEFLAGLPLINPGESPVAEHGAAPQLVKPPRSGEPARSAGGPQSERTVPKKRGGGDRSRRPGAAHRGPASGQKPPKKQGT